MKTKLNYDEFYIAYTDFYWDWYNKIIEEGFELYKKWSRYTNKSFFIKEYLDKKNKWNT